MSNNNTPPKVSISITTLIELVVGSKEFSIIRKDDELHQTITSCGGWQQHAMIENEEYSTNWRNEPLGKLEGNLLRLWPIKHWEIADNKRKQLSLELEAKRAAYAAKVEAVRHSMLKTGILPQIADAMLATMNATQIENMANLLASQSNSTGAGSQQHNTQQA